MAHSSNRWCSVADLGGFNRFQLKPPFRSLNILVDYSVPVAAADRELHTWRMQYLES